MSERPFAECHYVGGLKLSLVTLSVVILNVIMLIVVLLSVIMLKVVALFCGVSLC
jgi:hypothetical protein